MITRNVFRSLLTACVILVILFRASTADSRASTAEIVYDSIGDGSTGEGALFSGHLFFASLIQLDGRKRRVESLELNLHARDRSVAPTIVGAIHLDDGDGQAPGSLLWESTPREFPLGISPSQRVLIDVPFVPVPDRLWVLVGVDDDVRDGSSLRLRAIEYEAFVGENEQNLMKSMNSDDFTSSGSTWAMSITAVPEPATCGLLITALAALPILRRRRS